MLQIGVASFLLQCVRSFPLAPLCCCPFACMLDESYIGRCVFCDQPSWEGKASVRRVSAKVCSLCCELPRSHTIATETACTMIQTHTR